MSRTLGEMLVEARALTEAQLKEALVYQRNGSLRLGEALLRLGFVDESMLARTLAKQQGLPFVDLDKGKIAEAVLARIPAEIARDQLLLPVMEKDGRLIVAVDDPLKRLVAEQLQFQLGTPVACALAAPTALKRALERYYGEKTEAQRGALDAGARGRGRGRRADRAPGDAHLPRRARPSAPATSTSSRVTAACACASASTACCATSPSTRRTCTRRCSRGSRSWPRSTSPRSASRRTVASASRSRAATSTCAARSCPPTTASRS